jgi:hypothetical protein
MSIATILLPVFVLVALTFILIFTLGLSRANVIKRGEVRIPDIALGQRVWPVKQQQISNCYDNQFQMPVLFYVLTILAIITRHADYLFVVLAWVFVATRLVHAYIHCTSNYVRYRFFSFAIGLIVLIAMWAIFAAQILAGV